MSDFAVPSIPCHDVLPCHRSQKVELDRPGLSPLKPQAPINKVDFLGYVVTMMKRRETAKENYMLHNSMTGSSTEPWDYQLAKSSGQQALGLC